MINLKSMRTKSEAVRVKMNWELDWRFLLLGLLYLRNINFNFGLSVNLNMNVSRDTSVIFIGFGMRQDCLNR